MNRNTTYALFGITFAIVIGMVGTSLPLTQSLGLAEKQSTSDSEGIAILGHVTTILKDTNGNIKSYRQTDNMVVDSGKNCVAKLLFGGPATSRGAAGNTVCIGANTAPWNVIGIGNDTTSTAVTPVQSDYALQKEQVGASGKIGNQFNARTTGTISWSSGNQTGTSGSSSPVISATFGPVSGIGSSGLYVVSSGLFNNTAGQAAAVNPGGMFAEQGLSTPILVNNGDSLTIKWTINVG